MFAKIFQMELDHSSSPLIELALSSCIPFHPHDKRQKCWTRDAELSQVKASGPTCHTSKLIKRCHVALIWFTSSLPSSLLPVHASSAKVSPMWTLLWKKWLRENISIESTDTLQLNLPKSSFPSVKVWRILQEIVSEISGNTQRAWPYESFSSVHVTTTGVDRGCTHPS